MTERDVMEFRYSQSPGRSYELLGSGLFVQGLTFLLHDRRPGA